MKIAISTDGDLVSPHFGRCPIFTILDIENGNLVKKEIINNPGHHPSFLPDFFHKMGVECIIAGGMGMRATDLFNETGIKTIVGINDTIDNVINQLLNGTVKGGESLCKPGLGKGYGLDKTVCDHSEKEDHSQ